MAKAITIEKLYDELKAIKEDVSLIKHRILDVERMTPEEEALIAQTLKEHKDGKTTPLEALEKGLGA